jgi:hypothetical protein
VESLGKQAKSKYHELEMCILRMIVLDGEAVFMRSTKRLAQGQGLDFDQTEGHGQE